MAGIFEGTPEFGRRALARVHVIVTGAVQGVGFRPFVYRLAHSMRLTGWVMNSPDGVIIEAEGPPHDLEEFMMRLDSDRPPASAINHLQFGMLEAAGFSRFEIKESACAGQRSAVITADIATCLECRSEIFDPGNRRYRYPFTNCTNCGPRFTIVERIPYDRPNTTMRKFAMCEDCRSEYEDPLDRRFHAQPNACSSCGPSLSIRDASGKAGEYADPLLRAAELLRESGIVAVKGLGGFHLMVNAADDAAVARLRQRKHREEKPFALMTPSLESARKLCHVTPAEESLLVSHEAPIVLLQRRSHAGVADSVAPQNPCFGLMLPYTPMHHLLMAELAMPMVVTSGNRMDEPICIDEADAVNRLAGIADAFLVHDRPIRRPVDDSIARVILGREQLLRRARGYAPLPVLLKGEAPSILAAGAHLKNTVALAVKENVFISQHIGDLETEQAFRAFRGALEDIEALYPRKPQSIACDLHPDFISTRYAAEVALTHHCELVHVQHHCAHVAACLADNGIDGPALGVAWDGAGYGLDGTIWGGEFLLVGVDGFAPEVGVSPRRYSPSRKEESCRTLQRAVSTGTVCNAGIDGFRRFAHFRQFPLPGGDAAAKQPARSALGARFEMLGDAAFDGSEPPLLRQALQRGFRAPKTSSVGRLFDAVAYLTGVCTRSSYEGQAAAELEFAADADIMDSYPFEVHSADPLIVDWAPMLQCIIDATRAGIAASVISARFHNTLAQIVCRIAEAAGEQRVVLSGGCFQNRLLTERTVQSLSQRGFEPYWHQRVPPNDGGIALGQIVLACRERHRRLQ